MIREHRLSLKRISERIDLLLAPDLGRMPRDLEEVDRLDWELWLLVTLVLICLLIAFIINHVPGLLPPVEMVLQPADLEIYVDGLTVMILLFCLYVIQKHKQLRATRRRLVEAEITRAGLTQKLSLIQVLDDVHEELSSTVPPDDTYAGMLERVRLIMEADMATLQLLDRDSEALILETFAGDDNLHPAEVVPVGTGLTGGVARLGIPLLFDARDMGEEQPVGTEAQLSSAVFMPLIVDDESWGVLGVGRRAGEISFGETDLKLLQIFADTMSLFLRKNDLIQRLKESLKQNEETQIQLIQAEKLAGLGELMAGISHELNNPLSVVVGNTELLLRRDDISDEVRDKLEKVGGEAERTKRLVENLLRAARGEGTIGEEVALNETVEQSLSLMRYQLSLDNVILETDLADALPPSILDPFQIQQLIFNLVNNARQAFSAADRDERRIRIVTESVETGPPDGKGPVPAVHLQVSDTGPGIAEENLIRVFDPFFTTKEIGNGTGLGLSICYRIVRDLRGRIEAGNIPGGGAVFDIWLPLTALPEEATTVEAEEAEPPTGESGPSGLVLVVDDEPNILTLVEETLGYYGHTIIKAFEGRQALEILKSDREPDAIVLDLKMPVMDGQELFRLIQDEYPRLIDRVVFLTGDTLSRKAKAFLEASGRPFMSKPFSLDDLKETVEAVMEKEP